MQLLMPFSPECSFVIRGKASERVPGYAEKCRSRKYQEDKAQNFCHPRCCSGNAGKADDRGNNRDDQEEQRIG